MNAQRKGRAMGTGMDLAEAAGTPDFYAVGRLRARVAELEVEVNLLHRQRHAAQEDAANARLLAEVRQLSQGEIDRLRARDLPAPDVVPVPKDELAVLRDGFGLLRTAWNLSLCGERIGAQAGALIERYDALRAGEAGKGGAT